MFILAEIKNLLWVQDFIKFNLQNQPTMKKIFLPALLLLSSLAVFAQEQEEEHSGAYEFGRKNAIPIVIGVIVLIVLIVLWVRRRNKGSEPPQQTG